MQVKVGIEAINTITGKFGSLGISKVLIMLVLAWLLTACGGGSDSDSDTSDSPTTPEMNAPKTVKGSAVKGPLQLSSISFYNFGFYGYRDGGPIISTTTDVEGNFTSNLPANTGNVLVGVTGGGFFDESDPSGERYIDWQGELLSYLPAGQSTAAITPISDRLVRKSQKDSEVLGLFPGNVNENRRQAVLAFGFDPITVIPPNPVKPLAGATQQQLLYALTLGGIAQAVNTAALKVGLSGPNFEVLHAVLVDLEDCKLDGALFGVPVFANNQQLPPNNLENEIERFRNNNPGPYSGVTLHPINQQLCANLLPYAQDDLISTNEDVPVDISVLANDADPDGSLDASSMEIIQSPSHGQINVLANGIIGYVPDLNYFGPDSFQYRLVDNLGARTNTATANLDIIDVNDLPVANDDARAILEDSGLTTIDVLANDTDIDGTIDPTSLFIVSGPANGVATVNTGQIQYTPNPNFNGSDPITYQVRDDDGDLSNVATLAITVGALDDPPVISNILDATITEDTSFAVGFNVDDVEDGAGPLIVSAISSNTSLVPGANIILGGAGVNRTISVTPVANGFGSTSITVIVTDSSGQSASDNFLLNVTPVNDPPVITDIVDISIPEDGTTGPLGFGVSDVDDSVTTLTISVSSSDTFLIPLSNIVFGGSGNNRTITATPIANESGSSIITVTVTDPSGLTATDSFAVNVTDVNDLPTANDDVFFVTEDDSPINLGVLANDSTSPDVGETLTITAVSVPSNGGAATIVGTAPSQEITYQPGADISGVETFTYTVNDGTTGSDSTATVTINIAAVNDAPIGNPDSISLAVGQKATILNSGQTSVLSNDTDVDSPVLTANIDKAPASVECFLLNSDGTFEYQHDGFGSTTDSFTYFANDGALNSGSTTVSIAINPDRDGDGVSDTDETNIYGTDPDVVDTDNDTISDGAEVYDLGSDPNDDNDPLPNLDYLKASNAESGDEYGFSVSISDDGNTLAVGAQVEDGNSPGINGDESNNSQAFSGAVYVYTRQAGVWTKQAYIKASIPGFTDYFGRELALSGDGKTLAVSAIQEDSNATGVNGDENNSSAGGSGAVYVFINQCGVWSQQAFIKASNTAFNDTFGDSVAISQDGNVLAVGATGEDSNAVGIDGDQTDNSEGGAGAVYVYTRSGSTWNSTPTYIKASNTQGPDTFGDSVALNASGNILVVGASNEDSNATGVNPASDPGTGTGQFNNAQQDAGAVYVFTESAGMWTQSDYIKPSQTGFDDSFGYSVALNDAGDVLAVGARLEGSSANDPDDLNAGAVYVFTGGPSSWIEDQRIPGVNRGDQFGESVTLNASGNLLAVGAVGEQSNADGLNPVGGQADNSANNTGAVYVYSGAGPSWALTDYLKASNSEAQDQFGYSVDMDAQGQTLAVGAPFEDSNSTVINSGELDNSASSAGAAYVYHLGADPVIP